MNYDVILFLQQHNSSRLTYTTLSIISTIVFKLQAHREFIDIEDEIIIPTLSKSPMCCVRTGGPEILRQQLVDLFGGWDSLENTKEIKTL